MKKGRVHFDAWQKVFEQEVILIVCPEKNKNCLLPGAYVKMAKLRKKRFFIYFAKKIPSHEKRRF